MSSTSWSAAPPQAHCSTTQATTLYKGTKPSLLGDSIVQKTCHPVHRAIGYHARGTNPMTNIPQPALRERSQ